MCNFKNKRENMSKQNTVTLLLNTRISFIPKYDGMFALDELRFFEMLDRTFIPLIQMFDRLEDAHTHFSIAIVLHPILRRMLLDPHLIGRYINYTDTLIELEASEIARFKNNSEILYLAKSYYDDTINRRYLFTECYQKNILGALLRDYRYGKIELIGTTVGGAFLPYYSAIPEVVSAQIEASLYLDKLNYYRAPQGFWLPQLAYSPQLDKIIKDFKFAWTIIDTHTALLSSPSPPTGSFYPLRSAGGVTLLVRDFSALDEIINRSGKYPRSPIYRSCEHNDSLKYSLTTEKTHPPAEYKYYSNESKNTVYNVRQAFDSAVIQARSFINRRIKSLNAAHTLNVRYPVSVCAYDAEVFGSDWYEGITFLEELFKFGSDNDNICFKTPSEYLECLTVEDFTVTSPCFTSEGIGGYGKNYIDPPNDKIYRHLIMSSVRMTELCRRFEKSNDDLQERVLRQMAIELLIAQDSYMIRGKDPYNATGDVSNIEMHLKNFTTFYESLGSSYISTRLLTETEQRNNMLSGINHGMFRYKTRMHTSPVA